MTIDFELEITVRDEIRQNELGGTRMIRVLGRGGSGDLHVSQSVAREKSRARFESRWMMESEVDVDIQSNGGAYIET